MRVNLREIAAAAEFDAAKALLDAAGDLGDYVPCHNEVLVATYIAPEKVGSIIRPDAHLAEDRYQGKCALVLKTGPKTTIDVKPGDWVVFRNSDAIELFIRDRRKVNEGISARLVEDTYIRMIVTDPSLIY